MDATWSNPSVIQTEVFFGSLIIIVSIAYMVFTTIVSFYPPRSGLLSGLKRFIVVIAGWIIVFVMQLAYISSRGVLVYGVVYNSTTGDFTYLTARNPMEVPVTAVMFVTAMYVLGLILIVYSMEQYKRVETYVEY